MAKEVEHFEQLPADKSSAEAEKRFYSSEVLPNLESSRVELEDQGLLLTALVFDESTIPPMLRAPQNDPFRYYDGDPKLGINLWPLITLCAVVLAMALFLGLAAKDVVIGYLMLWVGGLAIGILLLYSFYRLIKSR